LPKRLNPKYAGKYIDQDDLEETAYKIIELIKSEQNDFYDNNSKRIILGGYGQGGITALAAHNWFDGKLGGVFALNGMQGLVNITKNSEDDTPILLYNGYKDNLVSAQNAKASFKFMHSYKDVTQIFDKKLGKHELSKKEITEVQTWINRLTEENTKRDIKLLNRH